MSEFFLALEQVSVKISGQQILKDINFKIGFHEQWVITGPSGGGKTVLAHVLSGRQFFSGKIYAVFGAENLYHSVILVEQQHRFKDISNQNCFYYQQRFNSCDADKTLTVREELAICTAGNAASCEGLAGEDLLQLLQVDHLLDEPLIQLSNGENKRLQIVKALMQGPKLLILDQPFIGLDQAGRKLLHGILDQLHAGGRKILLISSPKEIPDCFTNMAVLEKGSLVSYSLKADNLHAYSKPASPFTAGERLRESAGLHHPDFEFAVRMVDTTIRYGGREILSHLNWAVRKGDKCCITGSNGAGKSTLLSLISGDNPQAYANEIYLFDRRRGSGETIWDIKKNIGFVSPEMHAYFDPSSSCFETVASGLFDTIGLFRQLSATQKEQVMQWMEIFDLQDREHLLLSQLPAGKQRLAMLARALIKSPPLLLLDEPCQGLDDVQTSYFKSLIDQFCEAFHTTLIYVSHYLDDVPGSVRHFWRIEDGRIWS